MELDTRLPLQAQALPLPFSANTFQQLKQGRMQNSMLRLQEQGAQRQNQFTEATRAAYQRNLRLTPEGTPKLDEGAFVGDLAGQGFSQEAYQISQELQAKNAKAAEEKLNKVRMVERRRGEKVKELEPYLRAITDPELRSKMLKESYKAEGLLEADFPDAIDDDKLEKMFASANAVNQPKGQWQLSGNQWKYMSPFGVVSNPKDAEGKEIALQGPDKPGQIVQTSEGPSIITPGSTIATPITEVDLTGKGPRKRITAPETTKTTEGEANAALFGKRIGDAIADMNQLAGAGYNRADWSEGAKSLAGGVLGEGVVGENLQVQQNAERNFLTAALRRESGASIAPSEFDTGAKLYFPRSGDSPKVLEKKARNRQRVYEQFKAASGKAWEKGADVGGAKPPAAGTVEDGYRFKGGDPKDPKNWEKVP